MPVATPACQPPARSVMTCSGPTCSPWTSSAKRSQAIDHISPCSALAMPSLSYITSRKWSWLRAHDSIVNATSAVVAVGRGRRPHLDHAGLHVALQRGQPERARCHVDDLDGALPRAGDLDHVAVADTHLRRTRRAPW